MKPHFYKVNALPGESYTALHLESRNFGSIWHYHPELELHYTVKGHGMRFIGDNVSTFKSGEVIFLGENLPHSWQCQKEYYDEDPQASVEAVVVQFLPDCMGKEIFSLPEAYLLPRLFEKAKMGMVIQGSAGGGLTRADAGRCTCDRPGATGHIIEDVVDIIDYGRIRAHYFSVCFLPDG